MLELNMPLTDEEWECLSGNDMKDTERVTFQNQYGQFEYRRVIHAHWVLVDEDWNEWECSNCHSGWNLVAESPEECNMKYCHGCGAIMDEEDYHYEE